MPVTFKQFIKEAAVGEDIKPKVLSLEEAVDTVITHCRSNRGLYVKRAFYKGFKEDILKGGENYAIVDTRLTKRKSQNTPNFYTMILDDLAKENGFPLRSKSLVGSTSDSDADGYAGPYGLFAMIPFDDAKVGFVNDTDMWDKFFRICGVSVSINEFSDGLHNVLDISDDSIDNIRDFGDKVQDHSSKEFGRLAYWLIVTHNMLNLEYSEISKMTKKHNNDSYHVMKDDIPKVGLRIFQELDSNSAKESIIAASKRFTKDVFENINHERLKLTFKKGNAISESDFNQRTEVWIEGKVLLVRDMFMDSDSPYQFEFGPALKERIK